jgi:hypothetical protein
MSTPSIATLATVELQLVMQCLDLTSLLSLARCSRTTLTAASSDFACRYLMVDVDASVNGLRGSPAASRVLRHCDVAVHWSCTIACTPRCVCSLNEAGMAMLQAIPRMRVIETEADMSTWSNIFSNGAFAGVTRLRGQITSCPDIGRAWIIDVIAARMHALESLSLVFRQPVFKYGFPDHTSFASLARLQRLSHLEVRRSGGWYGFSLHGCTALRWLHVNADCSIRDLLCGAHTIEHLTLSVREMGRTDFGECFRMMVALRTLVMYDGDIHMQGAVVDALCQDEAAAPALELVAFAPMRGGWFEGLLEPSADELRLLVRARPTLGVEILHTGQHFVSDSHAFAQFAPLCAEFPDRVIACPRPPDLD